MMFDHQRLDVYRIALDFVIAADDIVEQLPKGRETSPTSFVAHPRPSASTSPKGLASSAASKSHASTALHGDRLPRVLPSSMSAQGSS
jgi:hypothetical protein